MHCFLLSLYLNGKAHCHSFQRLKLCEAGLTRIQKLCQVKIQKILWTAQLCFFVTHQGLWRTNLSTAFYTDLGKQIQSFGVRNKHNLAIIFLQTFHSPFPQNSHFGPYQPGLHSQCIGISWLQKFSLQAKVPAGEQARFVWINFLSASCAILWVHEENNQPSVSWTAWSGLTKAHYAVWLWVMMEGKRVSRAVLQAFHTEKGSVQGQWQRKLHIWKKNPKQLTFVTRAHITVPPFYVTCEAPGLFSVIHISAIVVHFWKSKESMWVTVSVFISCFCSLSSKVCLLGALKIVIFLTRKQQENNTNLTDTLEALFEKNISFGLSAHFKHGLLSFVTAFFPV